MFNVQLVKASESMCQRDSDRCHKDFMREHRAFRLHLGLNSDLSSFGDDSQKMMYHSSQLIHMGCRRRCSFLVLDEGDKMLDDGFEEEVVLIGGEAPESCFHHVSFSGESCDFRGSASEFMI